MSSTRFSGIVRLISALVGLTACLTFEPEGLAQVSSQPQVYTVEDVNDSEFARLPPPRAVHEVIYQFEATTRTHDETIPVLSTSLRNLSITLENRGQGIIRKPYLFGPRGWDFRSLEAIAAAATNGPRLSATEKFIRLHEWKGLHVTTVLGGSHSPYKEEDFAGNPLRILNQYGHAMCGQSTNTVNCLLRAAPPLGSMYGRRASLDGHVTGEAFFEGAWHAFDATPGTGVVQWLYYDEDNLRLAPSWSYLITRPDLVSRVKSWIGFSPVGYLDGATGETTNENRAYPHWDFNYDLRPGESLTLHFDMRGRLDRTSARQDNSRMYRCYSDYGSGVFTYRPDLKSPTYRNHIVSEANIRSTASGLVAADPAKPAWVVFELRSTWCFAGADIRAWFRKGGDVFIAVNRDPYDTRFPGSPSWQRLSQTQKEYPDASIEGTMAYWVKFQFQGSGSGLDAVEIASEAQMSPWSMPGLDYGENKIRLEAADLGGSLLRVTYRCDDRSPYYFHEPALSNYGRHIPLRIGGILQQGAKLDSADYRKARFWDRLLLEPGKRVPVLVEILKVSGDGAGGHVRRLVERELPYGWYELWWNGADDAGRRLPAGMYAYRFSIGGKTVHGERLYLYPTVWPPSNQPVFEPSVASGVPGGIFELAVHGPEVEEPPESEPVPEAVPPPLPSWEDTSEGPPASVELPLIVRKLEGRARFNRPRRAGRPGPDTVFVGGSLAGLPNEWNAGGEVVEVDVGGAAARFILDRRGRGVSPLGNFKLEWRGKGARPLAAPVFKLRLKGDLANEWVDEGVLSDEDDHASPCEMRVEVRMAHAAFVASVHGVLDAVAGESARFRVER